MRATASIAWLLLLSLGFLFHSVCSNDDGQSSASVTKDTPTDTLGLTDPSAPKTGTTAVKADGGAAETGTTAVKADGGAAETGTTAVKADGGAAETGTTVVKADGGASETGTTVVKADGGAPETGIPVVKADGGVSETGTTTVKADGGASETGIPVVKADSGASGTGTPVVKADGGAAETGTTTVKADGGASETGIPVVKADGGASGTGTPVVKADGGAAETGTTTVKADGGAAEAGTTVVKADGGSSEIGTTLVKPAEPTTAATTPAITINPTSKSTDKPAPIQPQTPAATNNPPALPTSISGDSPTVVNHVPPASATPSLPKTMTQAAKTDSSAASPIPAIIGTPEASVPSLVHSGTENPGNVGTTKITKVWTDAVTPGQRFTTYSTVTPKTSQEGSKGGTATVTRPEQTASRATEAAGNAASVGNPSTPTTAGTTAPQTTAVAAAVAVAATTTAAAQPKTFLYSLNNGHEKEEEKDLVEVCRRLMANLQDGNCSLTWRDHNGKVQFDSVEINGKVKTSLAAQYYEELTKKPTDNKTLIAILASCGALLIMIVILAVCASHHRKPYSENQQHLTEELHTVENGYHDNPTLEVMEVQPEMQEKKTALNGEFNDSWIVPIDNLLKEDLPDEEDTHL